MMSSGFTGRQVETTVLVGTSKSSSRYFNTQRGGQSEYLTVSLSDQVTPEDINYPASHLVPAS